MKTKSITPKLKERSPKIGRLQFYGVVIRSATHLLLLHLRSFAYNKLTNSLQLTSQCPYLEELGEPWVITVDTANTTALREAVKRAMMSDVQVRRLVIL